MESGQLIVRNHNLIIYFGSIYDSSDLKDWVFSTKYTVYSLKTARIYDLKKLKIWVDFHHHPCELLPEFELLNKEEQDELKKSFKLLTKVPKKIIIHRKQSNKTIG